MEIIYLTEDNVTEYEEFIPEDIAENIGRDLCRGLIAAEGNAPCGGMIWFLKGAKDEEKKESHILWFRAMRDLEGKLLLKTYRERILEEGVKVSTVSLPARTSRREKELLSAAGFQVGLTEGDEIIASLSEISEIPFIKKTRVSDAINPLRSVTQRGFNRAINRIVQKGYYGLCEDIESLSRTYFENDVSCYSEEEGVINGFFLVHQRPSGRLSVELMVALGRDYQRLIAQMIAKAVKSAAEIYPPETEILIDRHNYGALALGEKLFPRSFGIPVYAGSREEA